MINSIKSAIIEYGILWTVYRTLYSIKLEIMKRIPMIEMIFEKKVDIKRIDIFTFEFETISQFLKELDNNNKTKLIGVADKAINGIITGFSSIEFDYGNPIDWHLNPLTGYKSDKKLKWYLIDDFNDKSGDIKIIWEASRLTHFLHFARAYLLTSNEKYYVAFSRQLENWLENNIYSYGANYKCGQEATLRMINVLITYSVFKHYGLTNDNDKANVTRIVEGSYKKVLSNFFYAHKSIKNNHTFTEILGLIVGAWCSNKKSKLRYSYKLMNKEIKRQFLTDGGFTQYSSNYHRFTLQIFECLFKINKTTGINTIKTERIKKSIIQLFQVQAYNGDVPNYGSNDGALIFPLSTCDYRDFRPSLNTLYAQIEGKRLYSHNNYDEELLWFGDSLILPKDNIIRKTIAYRKSGFYSFRHQGGFLVTYIQNYKSRPAHMDQLHIDLWHKGINVFCDQGTYSYASIIGKELSSTSSHNTVKLEGVDQMNKIGAFFVTNWTKSKEVLWNENSFSGTIKSKNGYVHKRRISKYDSMYIVDDEILSSKVTSCDLVFHTPCDIVKINNLLNLYNGKVLIASIETTDDVVIEESYSSLYYLKKEKINKIKIRKNKNNMNFKFNTTINLY